MLETNIILINVITKDVHLGIFKIAWILPVIVQSAIAMIIDAKNNIRISFKLHKINMEMIKAVIENKVVGFKLYI